MDSKIDFLFYSPEIEKTLALDKTESIHAIKVLRKRKGDLIQVTDGLGGWFKCEITHPNQNSCELRVVEAVYEYQKPAYEIHIAICPTKNSDRIEYFLEKSIEIGITGVHFIQSKNTYPKRINSERLEKIAVSAMKQSLKAYKPYLSPLIKFEDFIKESARYPEKYIAHLAEDSIDISRINISSKTLVLIGPEGDFSEEELQSAYKLGFKNLTLGKNRLRTETAGVYAVSILNAFIKV